MKTTQNLIMAYQEYMKFMRTVNFVLDKDEAVKYAELLEKIDLLGSEIIKEENK